MQSQQTCLSETMGGWLVLSLGPSSASCDHDNMLYMFEIIWIIRFGWLNLDLSGPDVHISTKHAGILAAVRLRPCLSVCAWLLAHVCVVLLDLSLSVIIRCYQTEAPLPARSPSLVMLWWRPWVQNGLKDKSWWEGWEMIVSSPTVSGNANAMIHHCKMPPCRAGRGKKLCLLVIMLQKDILTARIGFSTWGIKKVPALIKILRKRNLML